MKNLIVALGACAALSVVPTGTFAHGYNAGEAALGGFLGGVIGGLIGSGAAPVVVAPAPLVVAPVAPAVVVPAPAPVVVAPYRGAVIYRPRPGYYYRHRRDYPHGGHQGHDHDRPYGEHHHQH